MGKCTACSEGKCNGQYENRDKCQDRSNCTCTCQESKSKSFWKGLGSVALGVAAFAGGTVLTVVTAGAGLGVVATVAAVSGCGVLTGAGATAAIQPVAKKMSGERMTGVDYVKDLAIGGTIGAVTGPIGLGGASATTSIASNVGKEGIKQGLVKFGCRTAVGAVSGATSSVIQEGANGQFSMGNVLKGAALGAATGGAAHVSGNVVKQVAETGIARSVAKVTADTVSTVAIDASYQGIVDGKVDGKKLVFNAAARAATSAGAEVFTNATVNAQGGKDAMRDKLGNKKILDQLDPEDRKNAKEAKKFIEKHLTPDEVEKQLLKATQSSSCKKEHNKMINKLKATEMKKADIDKAIEAKLQDSAGLSRQELGKTMKPLQEEKAYLNKQIRNQQRQIDKYQREVLSNLQEPDKLGGKLNVHALDSDQIGHFAADLPTEGVDGRGQKRIVFELVASKGGNNVRYKVAGFTLEHNYPRDVPKYGKVPVPPELKVLLKVLPKPFFKPKEDDVINLVEEEDFEDEDSVDENGDSEDEDGNSEDEDEDSEDENGDSVDEEENSEDEDEVSEDEDGNSEDEDEDSEDEDGNSEDEDEDSEDEDGNN